MALQFVKNYLLPDLDKMCYVQDYVESTTKFLQDSSDSLSTALMDDGFCESGECSCLTNRCELSTSLLPNSSMVMRRNLSLNNLPVSTGEDEDFIQKENENYATICDEMKMDIDTTEKIDALHMH